MDKPKGVKRFLPEVVAVVLWFALTAVAFSISFDLILIPFFLHPLLCAIIYHLMKRPRMWSCLAVHIFMFFMFFGTTEGGFAAAIMVLLLLAQCIIAVAVCGFYHAVHKNPEEQSEKTKRKDSEVYSQDSRDSGLWSWGDDN